MGIYMSKEYTHPVSTLSLNIDESPNTKNSWHGRKQKVTETVNKQSQTNMNKRCTRDEQVALNMYLSNAEARVVTPAYTREMGI